MSAFINQGMTNAGKLLLAKAQIGANLKFTKIVIGDGTLPPGTVIKDITGVIHKIITLEITNLKINGDGSATIGSIFNNYDLSAGFFYRELALFANDPDVGEILYCYGNAGDLAEWIPPNDSQTVVEKRIDIITKIDSAEHVTAIISSEIFVSQEDLTTLSDDIKGELKKHFSFFGKTSGTAVELTLSQSGFTLDKLVNGVAGRVQLHTDIGENATLNIENIGAYPIVNGRGAGTIAGQSIADSWVTIVFNGTNFVLQGEGGGSGNATADQILIGKTATVDTGPIIGTMPDNSGIIIGAYARDNTTLQVRPPVSGFYPQGDTNNHIDVTEPNLIAGNIATGVNIFGLVGTAETFKTQTGSNSFAYSTPGDNITRDYTTALISLQFTPIYIYLYSTITDIDGTIYALLCSNPNGKTYTVLSGKPTSRIEVRATSGFTISANTFKTQFTIYGDYIGNSVIFSWQAFGR